MADSFRCDKRGSCAAGNEACVKPFMYGIRLPRAKRFPPGRNNFLVEWPGLHE
jgi:hypothetical protein